MPKFAYVAVDAQGKRIKGEVESKDRASVAAFLSREPITIVSISEIKRQIAFLSGAKKIKLKDIVVFCRQLATLVKAGVPLVKGLGIISAQVENKTLKDIVTSLQVSIETGRSLSEALAGFPKVFSPIFINMVKAGEMGGALDTVLERVAGYLESADQLARKVKGALVYPSVVVTMAIGIVVFLFVAVIPSFQNMFATLDIELPLPTRILIGTSNFIKSYFLYVLGIIIAGFIGIKRYIRTETGRFNFDKICLKLPLFGDLFIKVITARFSRTLSTLVKSGISILNALDIVSKTADNTVVERALSAVKGRVSRGEKIGESLKTCGEGLFAPLVIDMITVGEETGNISPMLDKIADFYEAEVDTTVDALMSLLEPVIIILLGGLVGAIAVSLFLPILEIIKSLG